MRTLKGAATCFAPPSGKVMLRGNKRFKIQNRKMMKLRKIKFKGRKGW